MSLKTSVRRLLGRYGYVVRHAGSNSRVTGVELLHDVKALVGGKSSPVVFDVGANVGQTVGDLLATLPNPTVYSFEPSPNSFETLRSVYGGREGIHLENLALGDRPGTLPFFVTRDYSVNDSLLEPAWKAEATEIPVRVETLDEYCTAHGVQRIDFLKVDTQGYDLSVLHGARRMLTDQRVHIFCVELTFVPMYKGQPSYLQILSFIDGFAYDLVGFYDQSYVNDRLQYLNALYVTRKVNGTR